MGVVDVSARENGEKEDARLSGLQAEPSPENRGKRRLEGIAFGAEMPLTDTLSERLPDLKAEDLIQHGFESEFIPAAGRNRLERRKDPSRQVLDGLKPD